MSRRRRPGPLVLGSAIALATSAMLAGPALAEPPVVMTQEVTDLTTHQLVASAVPEIEDAAARVSLESDHALWVIYVDSFDGMPAGDWANETAIDSDAPRNAVLLAVAVDDDDFALSIAEEHDISDATVRAVEDAVNDAMDRRRWADAATGAAEALIDSPGGGGPGAALPWVIGGGVVVGGGVWALTRGRKNRGRGAAESSADGASVQDARSPIPTAELATLTGSALVQLDNDVRSSGNELEFAVAQFGLEATQGFRETLEGAQRQLGQAFTLHQQLERGDLAQIDLAPADPAQADPAPGGRASGGHAAGTSDEATRRAALIRILDLCESAERALAEKAQALAELRSLQERVPQVLDELDQRATELAARIPAARATIEQLRATYPPAALTTVAQAPDQAQALIASARSAVADGRAGLGADDRGTAVAFSRTAEDALQQVSKLTDLVAHARDTLEDARVRIDGAVASLTEDLADAARLAPADAGVTPAVDRAQAAVAAAAEARAGGDPIAALNELTTAEQALDAALVPHREAEQVRRRAADQLADALADADRAIQRADGFIETSRGAVDSSARARLTSARETLALARAVEHSQPEAALRHATDAIEQANRARSVAETDVQRWQSQQYTPQDRYSSRSSGIDPGTLILGGILGGSRNRGSGWGGSSAWGGGSSWGGGSGGGSWGGSTRSSSGRSSSSRSGSGRSGSGRSRSSGASRSGGGGARRSGGSTRTGGSGRRR